MANPVSGQKTVTSAGTPVALGSQQINGPVVVKALDTNTGVIAIGNDGNNSVTVSNGFRLLAGEERVFVYLANLDDLYLNSSVSGEGVSWQTLQVF